jgi:hypothetical protein
VPQPRPAGVPLAAYLIVEITSFSFARGPRAFV